MGEYFGNVLARAMSRRDLVKGALFGSAGLALVACGGGSGGSGTLSFTSIQPTTEDMVLVPRGFSHNVIIRWGDALDNGPNLDWNRIRQSGPTEEDVRRQASCFGYNCDFVGYFRTADGRHLLAVNHEYCNPELMFPNFLDGSRPRSGRPTRFEAEFMLEAHGLSIVEIRREPSGAWTYVRGSSFNRRITGRTPIDISGPARGHRLMRTSADPEGVRVLGTLNNCAAGNTPWNTVLTCEENFNSYFVGNRERIQDSLVRTIHSGYGVPDSTFGPVYGFNQVDRRFNVEEEPNEAFRFGWVIEVDPLNPQRTPVKRTALGRFKHEAAFSVVAPDGRVAVYMGDDERFQYIYKFVTRGTYNPNNREANFGLLDEGDLYVAIFNDDLTGRWELIASARRNPDGTYAITPNPRLGDPYRSDPALCFIDTRGAARALGATAMDRPEDIDWNPRTGSAWVALTSNDRRGASGQPGVNAANPRPTNHMGHILEIREANGNPTATTFTWHIPILCGRPGDSNPGNRLIIYGVDAPPTAPAISAPDNFVIDRLGNVWIATDGNPSRRRLGLNDGVYVLNPFDRVFKMFLSGPAGCEICGPEFTSDYRTFFCAIQHPGESDTNNPSSRWPYDSSNAIVPRPSVIAVWRDDGREIFV
ncbi:MAG: PhoX family phosphatase [Aquificaceae bacterium]|nr:PhoX family phosphatase [Aquificaceae bacterium]